jgi:tellurite methyltransferase
MTNDDRLKWNSKYKEKFKTMEIVQPNERLVSLSSYLKGGTCLDLACGLGANSLYLAKMGYKVKALDVSDVAIKYLQEQAKQEKLDITAETQNLIYGIPLTNSYDLIVDSYYLDRSLFSTLEQVIKPQGLFFMETFYTSHMDPRPGMKSEFKLRPNELLDSFSHWKVIHFNQNEQDGIQTILVQNK